MVTKIYLIGCFREVARSWFTGYNNIGSSCLEKRKKMGCKEGGSRQTSKRRKRKHIAEKKNKRTPVGLVGLVGLVVV